jgi:hypothetical protein
VRLCPEIQLLYALIHASRRELVQQRLPQMGARLVDQRDIGQLFAVADQREFRLEPRRGAQTTATTRGA